MADISPISGDYLNMLANPPSPFTRMGDAINALTGMTQYQMLQKDYAARQAMQQIYKNAIDPTTGMLNQQALGTGIQGSDPALWAAQQELQGGGEATYAQQHATQQQMATQAAALQQFRGYVQPLMDQDVVPPRQALGAVDEADKLNLATPEVRNRIRQTLQSMPPNANARDVISGIGFAATTPDILQQLAKPGTAEFDDGGYHVLGATYGPTDPRAGQLKPGFSAVPVTADPRLAYQVQKELSQPDNWLLPDGTSADGTHAQHLASKYGFPVQNLIGAAQMISAPSAILQKYFGLDAAQIDKARAAGDLPQAGATAAPEGSPARPSPGVPSETATTSVNLLPGMVPPAPGAPGAPAAGPSAAPAPARQIGPVRSRYDVNAPPDPQIMKTVLQVTQQRELSPAAEQALIAGGLGEGGFSTPWLQSGAIDPNTHQREQSWGIFQFNQNGELPKYLANNAPGDVAAQTNYAIDGILKKHPNFASETDPNKAAADVADFEVSRQSPGYYASFLKRAGQLIADARAGTPSPAATAPQATTVAQAPATAAAAPRATTVAQAPATAAAAPRATTVAQAPATGLESQFGRIVPMAGAQSLGATYPGSIQDAIAERKLDALNNQRLSPLITAAQILNNHPDLQTGMGAEVKASLITALHSVWGIPIGDLNKAVTTQELAKQLYQNQAMQQQFNATDLARLNVAGSQPNPKQARDAILRLLSQQIGANRFQTARWRYFQQLHPDMDLGPNAPDANFQFFDRDTAQWAANQDQKAYGLDFMPQDDVRTYTQGLPGKGIPGSLYENFKQSAKDARDLWHFKIPDVELPKGRRPVAQRAAPTTPSAPAGPVQQTSNLPWLRRLENALTGAF